jgi:hypothetical protein
MVDETGDGEWDVPLIGAVEVRDRQERARRLAAVAGIRRPPGRRSLLLRPPW